MKLFYLMIFLCLACVSCRKQKIESDIAEMKAQTVKMPYSKMIRRNCSMSNTDTITNTCISIVHYMNNFDCSECMAKRFADSERVNTYRNQDYIRHVYIFDSNIEIAENAYLQMKLFHSQGTVYIDTASVFIKKNPQISKNILFHTFVMNHSGEVLLVGDPFLNKKMKKLFKKTLEQYRKP